MFLSERGGGGGGRKKTRGGGGGGGGGGLGEPFGRFWGNPARRPPATVLYDTE